MDQPSASFGDYCPAPPELNIEDIDNSTGPLDSDNTYIAEYLVKVATDVQPSVFFQQVQAGFVISHQEPAVSFCGISDGTSKELSGLLEILYHTISAYDPPTPSCEDSFTSCADDDDLCACVEALGCVNATLSTGPNSTLPGNYYKNISAHIQTGLEQIVCNVDEVGCHASGTPDSLAQIYPVQSDTLTVTVWYNNQVSRRDLDGCTYIDEHVLELVTFLKEVLR